MTTQVSCPTCERPVEWSEASPHRPFCSERCRLIDLGAWVDGTHRIPGEPAEIPEGRDEEEGPNAD